MPALKIGTRSIGPGCGAYLIAEMSANHGQNFDRAVEIIRAAKDAGADAIKLQTYTPDTITIDCDGEHFRIGPGSIWEGRGLYELYEEAHTPWDWQPRLKAVAYEIGIDLFSTPFDATAVDFLEEMDVPCHKVASFELVDIPLLRKIGATGKPVIMSTGMSSLAEIDEAVRALRESGSGGIALLKCTSAYPASPDDMDLRTIPHMAEAFGVPVGLSDHTLDIAVPVAAVALGACIVEKHFTLSRDAGGPDSAFSLEPREFKAMVEAVRAAERALGDVRYELTEAEKASRVFRRSLFVVKDMKAGETFTEDNVRSIRPGNGLAPRHLVNVLGRRTTMDVPRGTPLTWDMLGAGQEHDG